MIGIFQGGATHFDRAAIRARILCRKSRYLILKEKETNVGDWGVPKSPMLRFSHYTQYFRSYLQVSLPLTRTDEAKISTA